MYYPAEIAANYIKTGKTKAALPAGKVLLLAVMAGIYIALAAAGANTVSAAFSNPALARLGAAAIFPAGLLLVLIAGSELFTGNCLLVIPLYQREITMAALLRNWALVFAGNFIGSLLIVALAAASGQWAGFSGLVATVTIKAAATKVGYGFGKAFLLGIGCNFLVCAAVWLSYAADSVGGKFAAIYLVIALFIICGFEHSVANMYYIPAGLIAAQNPAWLAEAAAAGVNVSVLSLSGFLWQNLLPVTLGNIVGGSLLLGTPYWYIYLRQGQSAAAQGKKAA